MGRQSARESSQLESRLHTEFTPQTIKRKILSTRRRQKVSGTVTLQIGFVPPKDVDREEALKKVKRVYGAFAYQAGVPHGMVGVLGVPAVSRISISACEQADSCRLRVSELLRSAPKTLKRSNNRPSRC